MSAKYTLGIRIGNCATEYGHWKRCAKATSGPVLFVLITNAALLASVKGSFRNIFGGRSATPSGLSYSTSMIALAAAPPPTSFEMSIAFVIFETDAAASSALDAWSAFVSHAGPYLGDLYAESRQT